MAKYISKPCIIEAIQWTGDNLLEIKEFTNGDSYFLEYSYGRHDKAGLFIRTLEGTMHASIGDYIIKGLRGEFYPCKPDVFCKKYELKEETR